MCAWDADNSNYNTTHMVVNCGELSLTGNMSGILFDNFIVKCLYSFSWTKIAPNYNFKRQVVLREFFLNKTPEQPTTEEFLANFFNSVNL